MELFLRFILAMTFIVSVGLLIAYKDSVTTRLGSWFSQLSFARNATTPTKTKSPKKFYFFPILIISIGASISTALFFLAKNILSSIFANDEVPEPDVSTLEIIKEIPWWVPESNWYFVGILATSAVIIAVWYWRKKEFPKKEFLTLLLGIPAVHWFTWSIFPDFWVSWLTSGLFFPMHIAVFITAYLAEKKSKGGLYKITLGLVMVSAFLAVKKTVFAQGISSTISSWWKPKSSAVPIPIPTLNRGGAKLPSLPFVFYNGPEKEAVMLAFPDDTTMWNIAACESQFRQFRDNGELVVNPRSSATGIFQIMKSAHDAEAKSRSIDITTVQGNIAYAKYLRETNNGYTDWDSSSHCWRDGYPTGESGGTDAEALKSPLPSIETHRIVAESLVVVLPDGEFTNKFYPGRYAMAFRVENPEDSVYALAEEIGSDRIHDVILTYDGTQHWNFMVKSISFRALTPSDTIRVWVRWQLKR